MGWKGLIRSYQAGVRRDEREAKRRQRELERQRREAEKLAELEQARLDVDEYENYVERLVTVHQEVTSTVDWKAMALAPEPTRPRRDKRVQKAAEEAVESYRPTLSDKIFLRHKRKQATLEQALAKAPEADEAAYGEAVSRFERAHQGWREAKVFAERVLRRDPEALVEIIRETKPFNEIAALGSRFEVDADEGRPIRVVLHVHGEEVVPKHAKCLLKSGRLSEKVLPKGRYFELYQDHVCSAVLRVAREVFALVPVDAVVVTAMDELLNTRTGHLEEQAILSVAVPRRTLESLRIDHIDPSDSMRNFLHRMNFKKTKGLLPIDPIDPGEVLVANA